MGDLWASAGTTGSSSGWPSARRRVLHLDFHLEPFRQLSSAANSQRLLILTELGIVCSNLICRKINRQIRLPSDAPLGPIHLRRTFAQLAASIQAETRSLRLEIGRKKMRAN